MKTLKTAFQFLMIFLLTFYCSLLQLLGKQVKMANDPPDSCETISLKLSGVGNKFKKAGNERSYLIIIGNSPKKVKTQYTENRISDAVKFLGKFHNIEKEKIVFGIGPSQGELGYLKFYINGELIDEIKTIGKGRLCFGMGETFK